MDWGDLESETHSETHSETPSPTSSGHRTAPFAPKKEEGEAWHNVVAQPCNLSERFSAMEPRMRVTRAHPSTENFPNFKVLRNGKKIPNTRR